MADLQALVVVDADPRSREVLAFGFARAGFAVHATADADEALMMARSGAAGLLVASLPRDGEAPGALLRSLKRVSRPSGAAARTVPVVVVGEAGRRDEALAAGVTEFIARPAFLRDIIVVGGLAAARHGSSLVEGRLEECNAYFLARALATARRTARVLLERSTPRGRRLAELQFTRGELTDARVGRQRGSNAWLLQLLWVAGRVSVDFGEPLPGEPRVHRIQRPTEQLLDDGPRFVEEFRDVAGRVGGPAAVYRQRETPSEAVRAKIPREVRDFLPCFDGTRSVEELVEDSPFPPFDTLVITHRLADMQAIERLSDRQSAEHVAKRAVAAWLEGAAPRAVAAPRPPRAVEKRVVTPPPRPSPPALPGAARATRPAEETRAPSPPSEAMAITPPSAPPEPPPVTPVVVAAAAPTPGPLPAAAAAADTGVDAAAARSPARSAAKRLRVEVFGGDREAVLKVEDAGKNLIRKAGSPRPVERERTGRTRLAPPTTDAAPAVQAISAEKTEIIRRLSAEELGLSAPAAAAAVAGSSSPPVTESIASPASRPQTAAPPVVPATPTAALSAAIPSLAAGPAEPLAPAAAVPLAAAARSVALPSLAHAPTPGAATRPESIPVVAAPSPLPARALPPPPPPLLGAPPPSAAAPSPAPAHELIAARVVASARAQSEAPVTRAPSVDTRKVPRVVVEAPVELHDMQRLAEMTRPFRRGESGRVPKVAFDPIDEEFFARESELHRVERIENFDDLDAPDDDASYAGNGMPVQPDERTDGWFFFGRRGHRRPDDE